MSLTTEERIIIEFNKLKAIEDSNQKKALEDFHARHKYLYFTYHQGLKTKLGQIVGNHQKLSISEVMSAYESCLNQMLGNLPTIKNKINAYDHMYGYFKRDVTKDEKTYYQSLRQSLINGEDAEKRILNFIKMLAQKHDKAYILKQSILDEA